MTYPVQRLIVHPKAVGSRLAGLIAERSGAPVTVASSPAALPERIIPPAKDTVFLAPRRGSLLKNCPGTAGHICCGYRVLNLVTGCPLDCTYCILQLYLNQPCLTVASNWEDSVAEVDSLVRRHPGRTLRLGTGELADSLALEPLTDMAKELIPQLLRRPEIVLELKTKTTEVANLLDIDPAGRVIVSWSLNAEEIIKSDERGAPLLEERLQAAVQCHRAGYRIGFHFDPLVRFPGWETGYRRAVEAVYSCLDPGSIAWISLGTLRYPPALDAIIRDRFPESRLPLEELVPGLDGKLRYFRPLREEMYRHVYREIRRRDPKTTVYLCMESREVWQSSLGWSPASTADLARRLDDAAMFELTTG
jgi:spore photoproduct lyase